MFEGKGAVNAHASIFLNSETFRKQVLFSPDIIYK